MGIFTVAQPVQTVFVLVFRTPRHFGEYLGSVQVLLSWENNGKNGSECIAEESEHFLSSHFAPYRDGLWPSAGFLSTVSTGGEARLCHHCECATGSLYRRNHAWERAVAGLHGDGKYQRNGAGS